MTRYVVEVHREDLPSGFITGGDTLTPYLTEAYVFADKAAANKATAKKPSKYTGWGSVTFDIIPVAIMEIITQSTLT